MSDTCDPSTRAQKLMPKSSVIIPEILVVDAVDIKNRRSHFALSYEQRKEHRLGGELVFGVLKQTLGWIKTLEH